MPWAWAYLDEMFFFSVSLRVSSCSQSTKAAHLNDTMMVLDWEIWIFEILISRKWKFFFRLDIQIPKWCSLASSIRFQVKKKKEIF